MRPSPSRISPAAIALAALGGILSAGLFPSSAEDYKADYLRRVTDGDLPENVVGYIADSIADPDLRDAMTFLYAYMPSNDVGAYSTQFFKENVEASLAARQAMPWGETVPQREWLHFVLPLRVNNEALDMSRPIFYAELKERLAGLSMEEAVLEVNHWCHEHVTYRPSDGRTSSPLSTVSQAIGRCGEESTFTVAALRAAGIPARQVYTPRWAHTDDNHAWVEARVDGKWHFLGACEPEPRLDMAWFNAPASRGMLMHTNVFGSYDGPEEIIDRHSTTTTINVTSNYAPVDTLTVRVVDLQGKPIPEAKVEFCIYNYTEFYPAAVKRADANGQASIASGKGDLIVRAYDTSGNFGLQVMRARPNANPQTIVLDKNGAYTGKIMMDIVPPKGGARLPEVSEEERALSRRRLAREDSVRHTYEATFATPDNAVALADRLCLDAEGRAVLERVMPLSRGNHTHIASWLQSLDKSSVELAVDILGVLCEKDLRDIPVEVLNDILLYSPSLSSTPYNKELYLQYVISPRVELEPLTPYREYFASHIPAERREHYREHPEEFVAEITSHLRDDAQWNPHAYRMDPISADVMGRADALSRSIYLVSAARACGIAARVDAVTGKTQYMDPLGAWHDVAIPLTSVTENSQDEQVDKSTDTGLLRLSYSPTATQPDPVYYNQFSISRIEGGAARQLEYPDGTYSQLFADPVSLDVGQYMLVSGQRMADGCVLAQTEFFHVNPGETTELTLSLRHDDTRLSVIGTLNAENLYLDSKSGAPKSILSTTGRGYYILAVVRPGHEPTEHLLNEMTQLKSDIERVGLPVVLLTEPGETSLSLNDPRLPSGVAIGEDLDGVSLAELESSLHLTPGDLPVVVIADSFNRVVYALQGYSIGTIVRLLSAAASLSSL